MPFPHPRIADDKATDEILWHTGLKIAQASSLVLPPLYVVTAIIRRARGIQSGFSINRMLRATWIGGTALSVAAPPIAWQIKLKNEPTAAMVDRWERLSHNPGQQSTDDYSLIGAALGALLVPTIFLRRTNIIHAVLGGSYIGMAGGVIAHLAQAKKEGQLVTPDLSTMGSEVKEGAQDAKEVVTGQK